MRWYVSYPILAAGLAFGFDTLFPDRPATLRSSPSSSEIVTSSIDRATLEIVQAHDLDAAMPSRLASFSPGAVLVMAELKEAPRTSVLDYLAQTLAPLDLIPVAATAPTTTTSSAATPVTVAAWTSAVIPAGLPAADAQAAARTATSREALARDIQIELSRVGCYVGEIDGVWGTGSKRAASIFMDRVNAALPTQEPDVFLLSLLRAENDEICGAACPQGQGLTANGRCVPATLLVQSDRARETPRQHEPATITASIDDHPIVAPRPVAAARPVPLTVATARPPLSFGRMSIGGPKPDEIEDIGPSATVRSYERTAAIAEADAAEAPGLETEVMSPEDMPKVERTSFDTDVATAPARKAKPSGGRSSKSARNERPRYSSYRHVQRLFENPLGRM
jgi:hypothetical protein